MPTKILNDDNYESLSINFPFSLFGQKIITKTFFHDNKVLIHANFD